MLGGRREHRCDAERYFNPLHSAMRRSAAEPATGRCTTGGISVNSTPRHPRFEAERGARHGGMGLGGSKLAPAPRPM